MKTEPGRDCGDESGEKIVDMMFAAYCNDVEIKFLNRYMPQGL